MSDALLTQIKEHLSRLHHVTATFSALSVQQRCEMIHRTLRRLGDADSDFGKRVIERCVASSGLSRPMVQWALRTSLPAQGGLESLVSQMRGDLGASMPWSPPSSAALVLAGNVFTACLRSMVFPLAAGIPLMVKASSRDSALPALMKEAWDESSPGSEDAVWVIDFPGADRSLMGPMLGQAELVIAYGSDQSLRELRDQTSIGSLFVGHGHGLGVAYITASALGSAEEASKMARALGLDICAYDQRGCLSPHTLVIQEGGAVAPQEFARLLIQEGIESVARELPRGLLPREVASHQLQWRGIAASRGCLFEGDGAAVSFEGDCAPRISPGWRNLQVLSCRDEHEMLRRVGPLGRHLKNLGVAATASERAKLAASLPPGLYPRVCAIGEMQTPPLNALMDGHSPWLGLQRFVDHQDASSEG